MEEKLRAGIVLIEGKVVERPRDVEHIMALSLDKGDDCKTGIIRCIVGREGDLAKKGYVDRSELRRVRKNTEGVYLIEDSLKFHGEEEVVEQLEQDASNGTWEYLGHEDPDIWRDKESRKIHVFFTMPFRNLDNEEQMVVHLGHAIGDDMDSLEMQVPSLQHNFGDHNHPSAKELAISPEAKDGRRHNLFESSEIIDGQYYSTVRVAHAPKDMHGQWEVGDTVFHPLHGEIPWASEHASPGPFLPCSFVDAGEGKVVGFLNGRGQSKVVAGEQEYGPFVIGLMLYDYEKGEMISISPEPIIQDPEAKTITFASDFVDHGNGKGTLYAHVDDSFVRAYEVSAQKLQEYIDKFLIPQG